MHPSVSIQAALYSSSLHLLTMQKTGTVQGNPHTHKHFSPFLFRIGYLDNSLRECQNLSCVITLTALLIQLFDRYLSASACARGGH